MIRHKLTRHIVYRIELSQLDAEVSGQVAAAVSGCKEQLLKGVDVSEATLDPDGTRRMTLEIDTTEWGNNLPNDDYRRLMVLIHPLGILIGAAAAEQEKKSD